MPRHDGYDIDGLPSILQYGSTKFVINLLLLNKDLLSSPSSNMQNSQQRLAKLVNTIQSSCWITYKRKRFAPNDVLLTSRTPYLKMGKYLDNILVISKDDLLKDIDDLSGSNKMWLLEEFLNFKQDLRDFNNSTIYKILNMLPDFDLDGTISEAVFNDIILKNDDRINIYQNSSNSGAAVTRNTALRNAKGRWIAFLDSDECFLRSGNGTLYE